ncbi:oxidation resistance protein 1 isoform X2 [Gouania willdenowi]|uniref:oxidation resistance protein 1 isoform X2 n=1 Tax=Gouania willdenowi TaxID=441366 RepID=UPI0010562958|nr:oxidation resistance protein 1-like isoform X2 [Gouania willdenowi]
MNREPRRDKIRPCYFSSVTSMSGSKLPAGVSQPPQFAKRPWETQTRPGQEAMVGGQRQHQTIVCRPLNHIPHIRNAKLRQYYLQGTSWDLGNAVVTKEHAGEKSDDSRSDRLFAPNEEIGPEQTSDCLEMDSRCNEKAVKEADQDCLDPVPVQCQSPSPEAEYDKLLDVEAVPMPDGQLCLLALPPECCEGAGPEAVPYLKLFCRYITDRKGVVSGILLVTSHKMVFDPCKTHPLVKENGCEEYFLSCSIDNLLSIAFFSDISRVHFVTSQQRRKGKKFSQKFKLSKSHTRSLPNHNEESASVYLSHLTVSLAKDVCEDEEADSRDMVELESSSLREGKAEETSTENHPTADSRKSSSGLMFVRLRVQPSSAQKWSVEGPQLRSTKALKRRDAWFALTKESTDELYAYLQPRRPDLCIVEEGEEEEGEGEVDEEFVVIEDKEEEEGEEVEAESLQRRCGSGDDWEMVLMEENQDKPTLFLGREPEGLHDILERSQILEASHVRELCKELPARTIGLTWQLAYSVSRHGSSLKSLYRHLSSTESPILIIIKDAHDEMFGAFLSHPLRPSETFYGTGETFLFMLHPRFKSFKWTGENSFFIKGDLDCFAIGGGSGHFGLWVDENLYLGRSSPCYTFNNCCLSETDDFRVMEMEVWTFS